MANILEKIKSELTQDYYVQHFPNDGQRFVAWYLRNIYLLDQLQAKDAITDGANDKQIDAVFSLKYHTPYCAQISTTADVRRIQESSWIYAGIPIRIGMMS